MKHKRHIPGGLRGFFKFLLVWLFLALVIGTPAAVQADNGPGTGPGGVGNTGGSSSLSLWLQADEGVFTDTACTPGNEAADTNTVGCWQDSSGSGNNVSQATGTLRPIFRTNQINTTLPILRFDGANDFLGRATSYTGAQTVFLIFDPASTGNDFESAFSVGSAGSAVNTWQFHANNVSNIQFYNSTRYTVGAQPPAYGIYSIRIENTSLQIYQDGALSVNAATTSTASKTVANYFVGRNRANSQFLAMDISEVAFFQAGLNSAERTLVENYLSAKYASALTVGDHYAGDNGGIDFDFDVAGIGQEADGSSPTADSSGFIIADSTFLQDNGDYLIAGHDGTTNSEVVAGLPCWLNSYWARQWYLDITDVNANGGAVDISFDFSEAGLGSSPSGTYALLKRPTAGGNFEIVAISSAIAGDVVSFTNVSLNLLSDNYYYTLGQLPAANIAVWDNAGGDTNWSTAANWSEDSLPASTDHVYLENATGNVTVDVADTIASLTLCSGYTGTVSQNSALTINGDLTQEAGSFIGSAATLDLNGRFTLNSGVFTAPSGDFQIRGNWTNNGGTFSHNSGQVTFTNSGLRAVAGSAATAFNTIVVANVTTAVDIATTATAGTLTNNGTVQQTRSVTGSGPVTFLSLGGYGGAVLDAAGNGDLGSTTVAISGNQVCNRPADDTIHRCLRIAPATTTGLGATIRFYYDSSELNGQTCSTMYLWHWNGVAWDTGYANSATQCAAAPYYVEVVNVSTFSPFAGKSGGTAPDGASDPTAITLQAQAAGPVPAQIWPASLLLAVLLFSSLALLTRRRIGAR